MTNCVFYHHPVDEQFSLDFVNPDLGAVGERLVGYDAELAAKVEEYELDQTVYAVYTAAGPSGAAEDIEYDLVDEIEQMEPANSIIATRFVDLFQTILQENYEQEGKQVQAYKQIDTGEIESALNQVNWNGAATDVAGRLASNLILKHALPNANHRTAIGMIQVYLRRVEPAFSMPNTVNQSEGHDEYAWMDWINQYIEDSKRLLTVRRKGDIFGYLRDYGCDVVERKHGIEIWLDEYDFSLPPSERWQRYAQEHEELWIDFTETAVQKAGFERLLDTPGLSKHEFAEELRNLQ